ncbi:MAG: hypothetical protein LBB07_00495 [Bifidobacteriaceae bacterium]|nr:hypothetical protein [Bifidobacteriaceae bacterium]
MDSKAEKSKIRSKLVIKKTDEKQVQFIKNLNAFLNSKKDKSVIGYTALKSEPELKGIENHIPQNANKIENDYLGYDIYLVPCIAVDKGLNRLGRGGGFYDRLIARMRQEEPDSLFIVCCFSEQIIDSIPAEPHDQKVDGVISDRGVLIKM